MTEYNYDRKSAVNYAHSWAYSRNPQFYDYENIGGDCTNFASQCIFAGAKVMDFTSVFGWYYSSPNDKTPSWTGVEYLYDFLVRKSKTTGPSAIEVDVKNIMPGDIIQLSFNGNIYQHSPFVVKTGQNPDVNNILIAAHSFDCDNRAISTYSYKKIRFLHILDSVK